MKVNFGLLVVSVQYSMIYLGVPEAGTEIRPGQKFKKKLLVSELLIKLLNCYEVCWFSEKFLMCKRECGVCKENVV